MNCAAIPETLIESEIFGHEKGALYRGSPSAAPAASNSPRRGTLLLDEIGEMPIGTQAKLLRVIEERKLRRLGSKVETSMDVRVLAATNKNPEEAVATGDLRGDLYYRLNVFNIHMPPLREHKEDIPALCEAILNDMNKKHTPKCERRRWRNVGRLNDVRLAGQCARVRNTIERAVILPLAMRDTSPPNTCCRFGKGVRMPRQEYGPLNSVSLEVGTTVDEAERRLILKTLESDP